MMTLALFTQLLNVTLDKVVIGKISTGDMVLCLYEQKHQNSTFGVSVNYHNKYFLYTLMIWLFNSAQRLNTWKDMHYCKYTVQVFLITFCINLTSTNTCNYDILYGNAIGNILPYIKKQISVFSSI